MSKTRKIKLGKKAPLPRWVGVIHLGPLPGSPLADSRLKPYEIIHQVGYQAIRDAKLLVNAGFDGILIENFNDAPFFKDQVPTETVTAVTIIATAMRESLSCHLGINVLRNDALTALKIAASAPLDFIRCNLLSGVIASDQGMIESQAAQLLREKKRLQSDVKILADVDVKHAKSLSQFSLEQSIHEVVSRSLADGVILTGSQTGSFPQPESIEIGMQTARKQGVPCYIGSGVSFETIDEAKELDVGLIIGSVFRKGGVAGQAIDSTRLNRFKRLLKSKMKKKKAKTKRKKTKSDQKKSPSVRRRRTSENRKNPGSNPVQSDNQLVP